jgi:lipopolysaccharide transport system permease protein
MAWMYLTPIIYPESVVPEKFRWLISINLSLRLFGLIDESFLRDSLPTGPAEFFAIVGFVVFVFGYWWFARTRKNFADMI